MAWDQASLHHALLVNVAVCSPSLEYRKNGFLQLVPANKSQHFKTICREDVLVFENILCFRRKVIPEAICQVRRCLQSTKRCWLCRTLGGVRSPQEFQNFENCSGRVSRYSSTLDRYRSTMHPDKIERTRNMIELRLRPVISVKIRNKCLPNKNEKQ